MEEEIVASFQDLNSVCSYHRTAPSVENTRLRRNTRLITKGSYFVNNIQLDALLMRCHDDDVLVHFPRLLPRFPLPGRNLLHLVAGNVRQLVDLLQVLETKGI